jgi:outer membrane protein OmpA-like peptidoglycan-associated protein
MKSLMKCGVTSGLLACLMLSGCLSSTGGSQEMSAVKAHKNYVPISMHREVTALTQAGGTFYQIGRYATIILPSDKLFEPATHETTSEADALIAMAASIMKTFPGENVLVTAHTDGMDSELWEAKLSYAQAKVVALKLFEFGALPTDQLANFHYAGMADTQPIADSRQAKGMAMNRHITITLYPRSEQAKVQADVSQQGAGKMKALTPEGH